MTVHSPTTGQWRTLYDKAIQLHTLAPWNWMEESDLFGVQHPEDETIDFVSVMGMAGEHFAMALYRGTPAMHDLLELHTNTPINPEDSGERIMEIPQLQLSFEDRELLDDEDLQRIKELGLRFRGAHAWPQFRVYRPGFFPWQIDRDDVQPLERALEQLLDIAPRFKRHPELLRSNTAHTFLVRSAAGNSWRDQYVPLPPPEPFAVKEPLDLFTLSRFKALPPTSRDFEVDLFRLWSPIQDGDECPHYPYILMLVDETSGEISGFDLLTPKPSLEEMRRSVPLHLLQQFEQMGGLPRQIKVRAPHIFAALQATTDALSILLEHLPNLSILDPIRRHFVEAARSGFDPSLLPVDFDVGEELALEEDEAFSFAQGQMPLLLSSSLHMDEGDLEEDDSPLTPLDRLGLSLSAIGPDAVPSVLQAGYSSVLTEQTIDLDHPGSLLRDFNCLLEAIGPTGIDITPANRTPKARFMTQLNEQLAHPIEVAFKRPMPRSYPNVSGLYLLLRVAGMGQIQQNKRMRLDPVALENWYELNPTEQYFTLLESWLQRGDLEILGDISSSFYEPIKQWLEFYPSIPTEGLQIAGDRRAEEYINYVPGPINLALMGMFGFVSIEQGSPSPNKGWCIKKVERTPFGDALLARLFAYMTSEWKELLEPDDPFFGHLKPIYQPFFPEWQQYLHLPEAEANDKLHIFKISLGRDLWRRIAAPAASTLGELATAILDAFAFDYDHLYAFYVENRFGTSVRIDHPQLGEPPFTNQVHIGDLPLQAGAEMTFLYDFGDHWEFSVQLERLDPPDHQRKKPTLIDQRGKAPEQYGDWDEG